MPDLQNFSMTRSGSQLLTVPTWTLSGQIVDSTTGALIHDFTGGNSVVFPQVMGQFTADQQDSIVRMVVLELLRLKGLL